MATRAPIAKTMSEQQRHEIRTRLLRIAAAAVFLWLAVIGVLLGFFNPFNRLAELNGQRDPQGSLGEIGVGVVGIAFVLAGLSQIGACFDDRARGIALWTTAAAFFFSGAAALLISLQ